VLFVHGTCDEINPIRSIRTECAAFAAARLEEADDEHGLARTLTVLSLAGMVQRARAWALEYSSGAAHGSSDAAAFEQCCTRLRSRQQLHDQVAKMALITNAKAAATATATGNESNSDGDGDGGWEEED
jgi:hypothetical protein